MEQNSKIIDCDGVSKKYEKHLALQFSEIEKPVVFATILTSDDYWSRRYQDFIGVDCERFGIIHKAFISESDSSLEETIACCNGDPCIKGILLFYPLAERDKLLFLMGIRDSG